MKVLELLLFIGLAIYALFAQPFWVFLLACGVYYLCSASISLDEAVDTWEEIKEKME